MLRTSVLVSIHFGLQQLSCQFLDLIPARFDGPHLKNVSEKAEKVFQSLPAHVRKHLPVVSRNILYKLLSEKQFVNLSDLLPRNRTPAAPNGGKVVCVNPDGQLSTRNASKQDSITDFTAWSRAFNVFMLYRVAVNPKLAFPMAKYIDHIAQFATSSRGYTLDQWLSYDKQFRLNICRNSEDPSLWFHKNEDAHTEFLSTPLGLVAGSAHASGAMVKKTAGTAEGSTCFHCQEYGHHYRNCPELVDGPKQSGRPQSFAGPYFPAAPGGDGGRTAEVCRLWNDYKCSNGPLCRYKRQHRCTHCPSRTHRQSQCPFRPSTSADTK